ncbi:MAG: class II aldolase/adducin family protein, partial [Hyphomicrobiales bacterium]|nr:class II aldolase/adducin family protein [Hyphomicrobiales bacterium]
VHSHSPAIVPFSISRGQRLCAVCHMAGFIGEEAPLFEIRETAGPATDLLIGSPALGHALAQTLGASNIVVMRGHGSTVTAPSLQLAVFRAHYADVNARYQAQAISMGPIVPLTSQEAEACVKSVEGQAQRPWDLWAAEAIARRR